MQSLIQPRLTCVGVAAFGIVMDATATRATGEGASCTSSTMSGLGDVNSAAGFGFGWGALCGG